MKPNALLAIRKFVTGVIRRLFENTNQREFKRLKDFISS